MIDPKILLTELNRLYEIDCISYFNLSSEYWSITDLAALKLTTKLLFLLYQKYGAPCPSIPVWEGTVTDREDEITEVLLDFASEFFLPFKDAYDFIGAEMFGTDWCVDFMFDEDLPQIVLSAWKDLIKAHDDMFPVREQSDDEHYGYAFGHLAKLKGFERISKELIGQEDAAWGSLARRCQEIIRVAADTPIFVIDGDDWWTGGLFYDDYEGCESNQMQYLLSAFFAMLCMKLAKDYFKGDSE